MANDQNAAREAFFAASTGTPGDPAQAPNHGVLVAWQWRQAKGEQPQVTCGCGLRAPLRFLYRCLYCGAFFCQPCAEEHFGKTREEYIRERLAGGEDQPHG